MVRSTSLRSIRVWHRLGICGALVAGSGCFLAGGPGPVSPDEIPELEARLTRSPNNGSLTLRLAAALYAGDRCDSAVVVAQRGRQLEPASSLGPMVIGQCWEQAGRYDDAVRLYREFADANAAARGVAAVRARELIARREQARTRAREAVAREGALAGAAPPASAVAVLPVTVSADSAYQPLSRGLAQMIISDLGLLQTFQLVERLELRAILDELDLSQTARVDVGTAARVGRIVRAGRMVQGLLVIPEEEDIRLEGSVVEADGDLVPGGNSHSGRFRNLLDLEKQLVIGLARQLGYQLSEAERAMILANGTRNLAAFLAYSRGLEAEELGDYATAAQHFGEAVRADPGFSDARTRHQANTVAPQVQQATASEVATMATASVADPGAIPDAVVSAVAGAIGDVAATQGEQTTESASSTTDAVAHVTRQSSATQASSPPPPDVTPPPTVTATIRIIFRIP